MDLTAEDLVEAALAGDPAPLVQRFAAEARQRSPLIRALLQSAADAPIAACFAGIWAEIRADAGDEALGHLRWYLRAECGTPHPTRAAVHRDALMRFLALPALPETEAAFETAFVAARVAVDLTAPLALHGLADAFLTRMADRFLADAARPIPPALVYAALGVVNLSLIRRLVDRIRPAPDRPAELQRALDWAIGLLIGFQGLDPWLHAVIEAEFARDSGNPAAAHRMALLGLAQGRPLAQVLPPLLALTPDPANPLCRQALAWAHWQAEEAELDNEAAVLAGLLQSADPDWRAPEPRPHRPEIHHPADPPPGASLGALLAHAHHLAAVDLTLGSPFTAPVIEAGFARLIAAIPGAPVPESWGLTQFLQAAEALVQLDDREFVWVAHFVDAPHAQGRPEYGTFDLTRYPALHAGLGGTAHAFCRAGLEWALAGGRFAATWTLARLVQVQAQIAARLRRPDPALAFLDRLGDHAGLADVRALALDEARLAAGDLAAARRDPPPSRRDTQVHAFLPRADWTRAEGICWSVLQDDPAIPGSFDLVAPDGRLQTVAHQTPARPVLTAPVPGLTLVPEGLLIGPRGHVLRPDPYHTSLDYPRPDLVVAAGQGGALRLRPSAWAEVDEPALVLEACAALHWPNYYHWMIPHLARIALAADRGLLDQRRLVLPQGLRRWMTNTLDLLGLPAPRRIDIPPGQATRLTDALVLSSIEHLSPSAIQALRGRLLGSRAGSDQPPPDGPFLYLSRRDRSRRRMVNEAEIEDLARSMGFQILAPEDLTIAQQIDLFARARGIAAPEGAALTNTLFAAPGTRVLAILCLQDMMPVFNDLALVLGHHHRKLAGLPTESQVGGNRFQPQFAVDPAAAARALAWVQGQEGA